MAVARCREAEEVTDPGAAFDATMMLAAKVAARPLWAAITKASHMDVDQLALAGLERRKPRGAAEGPKPKYRKQSHSLCLGARPISIVGAR